VKTSIEKNTGNKHDQPVANRLTHDSSSQVPTLSLLGCIPTPQRRHIVHNVGGSHHARIMSTHDHNSTFSGNRSEQVSHTLGVLRV
jgi:hypothetical protein